MKSTTSGIVLIAVLIASSSSALAWMRRGAKDALTQANELLVAVTELVDLRANIEAAKQLIREPTFDADPVVRRIITEFAHLDVLEMQLAEASDVGILCRPDDVLLLGKNHLNLVGNSNKDPYAEPQSNRRLNSLIIGLQVAYGGRCFQKLKDEFDPMVKQFAWAQQKSLTLFTTSFLSHHEKSRPKALTALADAAALSHVRRMNNLGLMGRERWTNVYRTMYLRFRDLAAPAQAHNEAPTFDRNSSEQNSQLVYHMLEQMCNYFESNTQTTDVFRRTMQLAAAVKVSQRVCNVRFEDNDLLSLAPSVEACKEFKNVDRKKLMKIFILTDRRIQGNL